MKTIVKITNEKLYNEKVFDVDTSLLQSTDCYNGRMGHFCANGHLSVFLKSEKWIESTGEHGSKDYESDYGFILTNELYEL